MAQATKIWAPESSPLVRIWGYNRPLQGELSFAGREIEGNLTNVVEASKSMTHTAEQMETEEVLRIKLEALKREHRDLDVAIDALQERGTDALSVKRLKKQKLALKDRIAALEDRLTPDIIA